MTHPASHRGKFTKTKGRDCKDGQEEPIFTLATSQRRNAHGKKCLDPATDCIYRHPSRIVKAQLFPSSPRQSMRRPPQPPQPHSISSSWALLFRLVSAKGEAGAGAGCEEMRETKKTNPCACHLTLSRFNLGALHSNALQQDLQQDCNGLQMCVVGGKS